MGITIQYSGTLRDPAFISPLIAETIDISESMQWKHELIHPVRDVPVRGILLGPENGDQLWLTFHEKGYMCNPLLFSIVMKAEGNVLPPSTQFWQCTRTFEAGVEAHIKMISFLRYLNGKYFKKLEVRDDSQYWETNDEAICRRKFEEKEKEQKDYEDEGIETENLYPSIFGEIIVRRVKKSIFDRLGLGHIKSLLRVRK